VWDAEAVLAHHLTHRYGRWGRSAAEAAGGAAIAGGNGANHASGRSLHGLKVVELGAGTGLAGCVCGLLGAAKVVLTELPEALPLLERNARRVLGCGSSSESGGCVGSNGSSGRTSSGDDNERRAGTPAGEASPWQHVTATPIWGGGGAQSCHERGALFAVEALEWGEGRPLGPACAIAAPFDLILIADCIYLPELYGALFHTVQQLAGPGTEVLICFEQRRRDISAFFDLLDGSSEDKRGARRPARAGLLGAEHLPGSDGRRPPGAPRRVVVEPAVDATMLRDTAPRRVLSSKLGWEHSPLLTQARDLVKVHLASVVFG
jgi:hypothetical protein